VTLTTPIRESLSSKAKHLIYSTCIQNLATFASAVPKIWLQASKWKMVTWPQSPPPYQGWFVILKLRYVMIYPCTKFNDSSFSRSRDIIGGTKKFTRVSAAADRPARRSGSAHAKYSVLHHGNQTISYARPSCLIQISTAGVTNSCPTTIREFMTLSWN